MHFYLISAGGDEDEAQVVAGKLVDLGHTVDYDGSVEVGQSTIAAAQQALAQGIPLILCATRRAAGSQRVRRLVNAANGGGEARLFAIRMEEDADLAPLTFGERPADWFKGSDTAIEALVSAVSRRFPEEPAANSTHVLRRADMPYLERPLDKVKFSPGAIESYVRDVRDEWSSLRNIAFSTDQLLDELLLMTAAGVPKRASALLFAERPQTHVEQAIVKCALYDGTRRVSPVHTEILTGTAREQIDAAFEFVRARIKRREVLTGTSARRVVDHEYPMPSVRELIVNAIVHRDYEKTGHVHVRLFSDRLEISSPGEWVTKKLGVEAVALGLLEGESSPRNGSLAHAMSLVRYFEGEGSGLRAATLASEESGAPQPLARQVDGFVEVTIFPVSLGRQVVEELRKDTATRLEHELADMANKDGLQRHLVPVAIQKREGGARLDPTVDPFPAAQERLALLVGPAGSGKTLMLNRLALSIARHTESVPLTLNLRTDISEDSYTDLSEVVHRTASVRLGHGLTDDDFRALLARYPAVLLVDGLDELTKSSTRSAVVRLLENMTSTYPNLSVVLSSRPVGVGPMQFDKWAIWDIAPLSDRDIERLALQWLSPGSDIATAKVAEAISRLAASPNIIDMMRSPLMANLIMAQMDRAANHGFDRARLLRSTIDYVMAYGDSEQVHHLTSGIGVNDIREAMAYLAYWAIQSSHEVGFSAEWMAEQLAKRRSRRIPPDVLVESITRNPRLLTSVGTSSEGTIYQFTYRTFLECLAAEHVATASMDEPITVLVERIADLVAQSHGIDVWPIAASVWLAEHPKLTVHDVDSALRAVDKFGQHQRAALVNALVEVAAIDGLLTPTVRGRIREIATGPGDGHIP